MSSQPCPGGLGLKSGDMAWATLVRAKRETPPLSQKCQFYSVAATRKATFSADPGSWPILGVQNGDSGPPPKNGLFILWRLQEKALFRPSLGPDPFRGVRKGAPDALSKQCQSR